MHRTRSRQKNIPTISWHFTQTTRDFSESLSPTRGGISHHGHVQTHISEVLRDGDTGVDGGFTSSDGHVGGVGDQAGTLHDADLFAVDGGLQLGEVSEDLSHFITTFSTTDVDNARGVGVL